MRLYNRYAAGRNVDYAHEPLTEEEVKMLTPEEAEALAGNCGWYGKKEEQVPIPRRICGNRQMRLRRVTQCSPLRQMVVTTITQWFPDGVYWLEVKNEFVWTGGCPYCGTPEEEGRVDGYACARCGDT